MGLHAPNGVGERVQQRLVSWALKASGADSA
jgi:hypothetical protein